MRRRYKVLPLPWWAARPSIEDLRSLVGPEFAARFDRDGLYLDRKHGLVWLERDGRAWHYGGRDGFQFELDHNDGNNRLEPHVFEAIGVLLRNRLGDRRLRKLYEVERNMRDFRKVTVESRKGARAMLRRLRKFAADRGLPVPATAGGARP